MTAYILYYYYYSLAAVEAESKIKHFRFVSGKVSVRKMKANNVLPMTNLPQGEASVLLDCALH